MKERGWRRAIMGWACAAALVGVGCGGETTRSRDGGAAYDAGIADGDGDGISDRDEGASEARDTDGDGLTDAADDDSDGDGLLDRDEAGDADLASDPIDSDADGMPDFIDLDSDDNGVPDSVEGGGDADRDRTIDAADTDDDGDGLSDARELRLGTTPPIDSDGDGTPDYRDLDSDDDTIADTFERDVDTDGDATPDYLDTDVDADGIPDAMEAGDADLATPPVDTDADGTPDFRDPDSDGDGLSDALEVSMYGTSPTAADTDGDGVGDIIELAAGTSATDGAVSPRTRGDFVFLVPYMEAPSPERDTLAFRTSIQFADVYFLFDRSGSMAGEIGALRGAVTSVIDNLRCMDSGVPCAVDADCAAGLVCGVGRTCIEDPTVSSCVASPWTGAGWYLDTYRNVQSLTADAAATSASLGFGTTGSVEALYRAAWNVADPAGGPGAEAGCTGPAAGLLGCPAFRADAVRILVAFTDEDSDGTETAAQAAAALAAQGIHFIGVWSGTPGAAARSDLVDLATALGSVDRAGSPLVFDGADASVVPAVTAAIDEVVQGVPLRATIEAADEPGDAGDALPFIARLEANTTGADCAAIATEDADGDGVAETFPAVTPGTRICWDVVPATNTTVMPTREPQIFRARLTVRGDGSPLDSRLVYFLVPPSAPVVEGPG